MCDNKGLHTQKIAAKAEQNKKKSRQSHNVGYPTFHYRSIAVYRSTSNITTKCAWEHVAMDSNTRWPSVRQICHAPDGNFEQLHQRQNFWCHGCSADAATSHYYTSTFCFAIVLPCEIIFPAHSDRTIFQGDPSTLASVWPCPSRPQTPGAKQFWQHARCAATPVGVLTLITLDISLRINPKHRHRDVPWHAFYISLFLSGTFWPRHHHMTIPVSSHSSSKIILRPTAPFVSKGSVAKIFACVVLRHSNFGLCVQDRMASTCSARKTQQSQLAKKIRRIFWSR